jgi:predicted esterase
MFLVLAIMLAGCGQDAAQKASEPEGTLAASPGSGGGRCAPGVHELAVGVGRKAKMRVTPGPANARRAVILVLHGAGGQSNDGLYAFRGAWNIPGLVIVAPSSRSSTWSSLLGSDVDTPTVDRSLQRAFARCRVDRRRIGVGGFSDGATYALSLGLDNGRLFTAVMALSPGGVSTHDPVGRPRIFIAHGTKDDVLPFSRTRDDLVPELRSAGYRVTLRTFVGGHKAPAPISRAAVRWFLGR